MATNEIQFFDNHVPILKDGTYSVSSISQDLTVSDTSIPNPSFSAAKDLTFRVAGPRFVLEQSLIHSVFPPKGGKGDYHSCLPSLVLNRSTLPWERSPSASTQHGFNPPWLYLFLVYESEKADVTEKGNAPLSDIASLKIPGTQTDLVTNTSNYPATLNYLEVTNTAKWTAVFPQTLGDLQYLSYARIKDGGEEKAVILCNRLPKAGETATAYLVSLENNYTGSGSSATFSGIKNDSGNYVLPYFYKWDFHAINDKFYWIDTTVEDKINETLINLTPPKAKPDLSQVLKTLYPTATETLAQALGKASPYPNITDSDTIKIIERIAELPNSTFHGILGHLKGGIAPLNAGAGLSGIAASGAEDLAYVKALKEGNGELDYIDTKAYYRSPLAAAAIDVPSPFPLLNKKINEQAVTVRPTSSKELIFTDNTSGKEDVSYSVAFELGRLTALNDVDFATQYVKWKSEAAVAAHLEQMGKSKGYPHYHNYLKLKTSVSATIPTIPSTITDKVAQWKNLEGIPYRYLVPNPSLIPDESIRFFQLDANWIKSFLCGAFSIGHAVDDYLEDHLQKQLEGIGTITGFFINSMVVSGWPDYDLDAIGVSGLIPGYPMEINKNLRLYLYSGSITQLEFYLHPSKSHSGFVYSTDGAQEKYQAVYDNSGGNQITVDCTADIDLKTPGNKSTYTNTIHSQKIATALSVTAPGKVAQFAGRMQAAVPRVIFTINGL